MKSLVICILCLFFVGVGVAQPSIQWQKCLGGTSYDAATSVQQTSDGGYVVTGLTQSINGDVSGNHGAVDMWITKLNGNGDLQWQQALGGGNVDVGIHIQQTNGNGYILTGFTLSNDGDVSGNHGKSDCWVLKLNNAGVIQWQKALGGSKDDRASWIQQTNDGGYVLAGYSDSNDGDLSSNHGYLDCWIVKLSSNGNIQWQKSFGGSGDDKAYTVRQTFDGGYIVAGRTLSNDGDVSGNHGDLDYWLIKLDSGGLLEWQKTFGGSGADDGGLVYQTSDGGYILAGSTGSNDGQVSGVFGLGDAWVVKVDQTGELQWQKVLGGSDQDGTSSIFQTSDGGYVLSISTSSTDGDVQGNDGGADIWVVKLSSEGGIIWQETYGGVQAEIPSVIQPTGDGGYIICGYTSSNNGDVSGNNGGEDFWVVKLSPESSPTSEVHTQALQIYPNPATNTISILSTEVLTEAENAQGTQTLTIQITDLLGRTLHHQTTSNNQPINVSNLPNGFHLLSATTPSGTVFSGKFTKQD